MLNWKTPCRELIADVCPEAASEPVYLLSSTEAAGVVDIGNAYGATGLLLSHRLRPVISEWRGPGFAAVFDIAAHRNLQAIEGTLLHEYAHWIERTDDKDAICQAAFGGDFGSVVVSDYIRTTKLPVASPPSRLPCEGHSPLFIRLCCHFLYRANHHNWGLEGSDIVNAGRYELTFFSSYCEALGNEPQQLASTQLATLHDIDPPEVFRRLAESDYARVAATHKNAMFSETADD